MRILAICRCCFWLSGKFCVLERSVDFFMSVVNWLTYFYQKLLICCSYSRISCNSFGSETIVINVPKSATLFCLFFICMDGAGEWLVETEQLAYPISSCLLSVVTILSPINNSLQMIFLQTLHKWMFVLKQGFLPLNKCHSCMRMFYTIEYSVWVEDINCITEIQFKYCHWY